jgi:hypothetical protein
VKWPKEVKPEETSEGRIWTRRRQMEAVRGLIPRFEAKIQRVLDRVWGAAVA